MRGVAAGFGVRITGIGGGGVVEASMELVGTSAAPRTPALKNNTTAIKLLCPLDFISIKKYLTKCHDKAICNGKVHVLVKLLRLHFFGDENIVFDTFRQRIQIHITDAREQLGFILRRGDGGVFFPMRERGVEMRDG